MKMKHFMLTFLLLCYLILSASNVFSQDYESDDDIDDLTDILDAKDSHIELDGDYDLGDAGGLLSILINMKVIVGYRLGNRVVAVTEEIDNSYEPGSKVTRKGKFEDEDFIENYFISAGFPGFKFYKSHNFFLGLVVYVENEEFNLNKQVIDVYQKDQYGNVLVDSYGQPLFETAYVDLGSSVKGNMNVIAPTIQFIAVVPNTEIYAFGGIGKGFGEYNLKGSTFLTSGYISTACQSSVYHKSVSGIQNYCEEYEIDINNASDFVSISMGVGVTEYFRMAFTSINGTNGNVYYDYSFLDIAFALHF